MKHTALSLAPSPNLGRATLVLARGSCLARPAHAAAGFARSVAPGDHEFARLQATPGHRRRNTHNTRTHLFDDASAGDLPAGSPAGPHVADSATPLVTSVRECPGPYPIRLSTAARRTTLRPGLHSHAGRRADFRAKLCYFVVVSLALWLFGQQFSFAYEVWTHQWISSHAFQQLGQHPMVQEVVALDALGTYSQNSPPLEPTASEVEDGIRILEGAVEEDFPWTRVLSHFWLPDSSFADGFPLPTVESAPHRANQLWKEALEAYCSGHKSRAYYLLGHVAHLLSDMTVPAHVNLDQHTPVVFLDYDTYERWCVDTNYLDTTLHAYRPNHERISMPLQSIDYFKLPPYQVPPEFDIYLAAMFYNTARYTREFDSDDSGHGFGPPSLVMGSKYNSFTLRLPVRTEMLPPASQTKLHRFNLTSAPAYTNDLSKGIELNLGWTNDLSRAYEYDSYSRHYPLDSCVYLYSGRGSFNGCGGSALYDLVDFSAGGQHTAVCLTDSGLVNDSYRFRKVPTSVLQREHLPQLLPRAIHAEAALYHLFWNTTHHRMWSFVPDANGYPLVIGDAAESGIVVSLGVHVEGSSADSVDFVSPCVGGAGGSADIRTGMEVDVGDGRLGAATGTRILTSGEYQFSDVLSDSVLQCEGDVTIRCQHSFQADRIELKPGALASAAVVKVFAGDLATLGTIPLPGATGSHVYPNYGSMNVYLAGQGTDADGNGLNGGQFVFWTKARGGISVAITANGGAGDSGGTGGAAGTCVIVANKAKVVGNVAAHGGDGSALLQAGGGGRGGNVVIAGSSASLSEVYTNAAGLFWLEVDVRGGNGGNGRGWQWNQAAIGQTGTNGFRGGDGGAGGTLNLTLDDWSDTDAVGFYLGGGMGGAGGLGQQGGNGVDGRAGAPQGGRGQTGGQGGRGGDGGAPMQVWLSLWGYSQPYSPGTGGAGAQGGQGGGGGWNYPGGGYNLGGNGGNGGTGGSAGGAGGIPGANGLGGLGGYSGFVITGQAGQPGALGGTLSPTVREPLAAPAMSCGTSGHKPGIASILAALGHGFLEVAMGAVPLHSNYRLEASEDLRNWTVMARTTTLDSVVSFRVAALATPTKDKQFFRIVAE